MSASVLFTFVIGYFVLLLTVALALAGVWAARTTALEAIPDLSDVQVIV